MVQSRDLPVEIVGVHAEVGSVVSMDQWARWAKVPHRSGDGILDGTQIESILGISSKAWEPDRFGDLTVVADTAREALRSARVRPDLVDTVVVVTCTPHQVMLDQDAIWLLRELGIGDDVAPVQFGAGCAGLARAMALLSRQSFTNALIVTYSFPGAIVTDDAGELSELYRVGAQHPLGANLWATGAIFADGAAALVVRHAPGSDGTVLYSRDSVSVGGQQFTDPLIHYRGGGADRPPGTAGSADLACYAMNGSAVKEYYREGMLRNHHELEELRPGYAKNVDRIYTHQANPRLVAEFLETAGLPTEKAPSNARVLGNLVSVSTLKLLHDDVGDGTLTDGTACFCLVGAGPERGAFIVPVRIGEPQR